MDTGEICFRLTRYVRVSISLSKQCLPQLRDISNWPNFRFIRTHNMTMSNVEIDLLTASIFFIKETPCLCEILKYRAQDENLLAVREQWLIEKHFMLKIQKNLRNFN